MITPNFGQIRAGSLPEIELAIRQLWQAQEAEEKLRQAQINDAKNTITPLVFVMNQTVNMNNLDIGFASTVVFTGSASINLTGIKAPSAYKSRFIQIMNAGSGTVTISEADSLSNTANQFTLRGGGTLPLAANFGRGFLYYGTWREVR